jgi:hypothetical protein
MDHPPTDPNAALEDDCIICGKWPERDRWALRAMTEWLPLQEIESVCEACLMAWARNVGFPVSDDDATEH